MRWIYRLIVSALVAIFLAIALLQTSFVREKIIALLTDTVEKATGYEISYASLQGSPPFYFSISQLKISDKEDPLFYAEHIGLSWAPWHLLTGGLVASHVDAKNIMFDDEKIHFENTTESSPWTPSYFAIQDFHFQEITHFKDIDLKGSIYLHVPRKTLFLTVAATPTSNNPIPSMILLTMEGKEEKIDAHITLFEKKGGALANKLGLKHPLEIDSRLILSLPSGGGMEGAYHGSFATTVDYHDEKIYAEGSFHSPQGQEWHTNDITILLPYNLKLNGKGSYLLANHDIKALFTLPKTFLKAIESDVAATFSIQGAPSSLDTHLKASYTSLNDDISFEVEGQLAPSKVHGRFTSQGKKDDYLFSLNAPFEFKENSLLLPHFVFISPLATIESHISLNLNKDESQDFSLNVNIDRYFNPYVDMGKGMMTATLIGKGNTLQGNIKGSGLPAKTLTAWHLPETPVLGTISFMADMFSDNTGTSGRFNFDLDSFHIEEDAFATIHPLKGKLEGSLNNNLLAINGMINLFHGKPMELSLKLPLSLSLHPPSLILLDDIPLEGRIRAEGEVGPFLKLLVTDTTTFLGNLALNMDLQGTWKDPQLIGTGALSEGSYESLDTGAAFTKIHGRLKGEKSRILLQELQAFDNEGGKISMAGALELDLEKKLPFAFDLHVDNALLIKQDYAEVSSSGTLKYSGDYDQGLLEGSLTLDRADIIIPEEKGVLSSHVDVIFIDTNGNPLPKKSILSTEEWPISLDLVLNIPKHAHIDGRNLKSEWKGSLKFTGTTDAPLVHGSIDMIHGEYNFRGRLFDSKQGKINFAGDPLKKSSLYISAGQQIGDINVEIILRGAVQEPEIVLRSTPPLSKQEILSWILFNRGIGEITPYEGEELHRTEITVSGGVGDDLLSQVRQSIGIDRVDINTSDRQGTSPYGANEVSLRIGKYISRGIFVSINKSINAEANQIAIEASLAKNLKFEAEVGDNAEGNFIIKWEKDY